MQRPALELGDVLRRHGGAYLDKHAAHLSRGERRVMGAVAACRTAALGGHVEQCDACGGVRISYNSCRHRNCPKCQGSAQQEWLKARKAELLPIPYFHVVFTLPPAAAEIAFHNKELVYGLLMRCAAQALATIAADPKHLGARIGLIAVLHTWGQTLTYHPHAHCIVPGGGSSLDGERWVSCKPGFFLPVLALSRLFRKLFTDGLEAAFRRGELQFCNGLAVLAQPQAFALRLVALRQMEWVVYAKPPFGGPEQVLGYLARYTHRAAIANSRIVEIAEEHVAFTYKDYRCGGKRKVMRLKADEFIRRFLLHVLPDGFHRIRHYGFLARGDRSDNIERCRKLIGEARPAAAQTAEAPEPAAANADATPATEAVAPQNICPACGGLMRRIDVVHPFYCDTS